MTDDATATTRPTLSTAPPTTCAPTAPAIPVDCNWLCSPTTTPTGTSGPSWPRPPPTRTAQASTNLLALLHNPRLTLTTNARADLAAGIVDPRLLTALAQLLTRHTVTVLVFKTGHPKMVVTDTGPGATISNHYYGRAMDLTVVDGQPVARTNSNAKRVVLELQELLAGSRYELGQPWPDLVQPGTFSNRVHQDHIHVGLFDEARLIRPSPR